jgi:DNA primase
MRNFIDFAEVKEKVSFADALSLLSLDLKRSGNQWRGPCPVCRSGGDRALVVTEGRGYYCFALRKGGDQIALAAHILGIPVKEAAQELAERAGIVPVRKGTVPSTSTSPGTVPESEGGGGSKLSPLSYLEAEHDMVAAVGFDPDFCKTHGIGYAPRGIMRGTIAIPFRDEHGTLLGYIGVEDCRIPADFTTNVVPLRKRA